MSSSSSEESDDEERNNALTEALQCDFVKEIFNTDQENKLCKPQIVRNEMKTLSTFEDNIAKILAQRLDKRIEEVEEISKKLSTSDTKISLKKCGIQLFTSSTIISNSDLVKSNNGFIERKKTRRYVKTENMTDDVYKKHASQVAVSPEWVFSTENTKYWLDNNKPRLINLKVLKRHSNEALDCLVINDEL